MRNQPLRVYAYLALRCSASRRTTLTHPGDITPRQVHGSGPASTAGIFEEQEPHMSNPALETQYLSAEELVRITGKKHAYAQCKVLEREGYAFTTDTDGRPLVTASEAGTALPRHRGVAGTKRSAGPQIAKLLDCNTAAEVLGCSDRTVRRLVRTRRIGYYRLPGGRARFSPAHIEAYLKSIEQQPMAPSEAPPRVPSIPRESSSMSSVPNEAWLALAREITKPKKLGPKPK